MLDESRIFMVYQMNLGQFGIIHIIIFITIIFVLRNEAMTAFKSK